jgi:type II secretory ATPase GspE/PulE/Tfp pilus assembly ATPase PilB-like protein
MTPPSRSSSSLVRLRPGFFELDDFTLHPPSVRMLNRSFCRRAGLLILGEVRPGSEPITLAMVHPEELSTAEEVARQLLRPVEVVRLTRYEIDRGLILALDGVAGLGEETVGRVLHLPLPPTRAGSSATELVDRMLVDAVEAGASDIHLERYGHDVDLRLRVDGLLKQIFTHITPENVAEVVARVMVLAELDVADRGRPQDGRIRITLVGPDLPRTIDLRVNVAPSPAGQDLVIRVLDARRGLLPLRALGLAPELLARWQRVLLNPGGLLLVTGPTGSGKTTTLYASLTALVSDGRKIITAEDPIEYVLDHVNQKQASAQLPFSELLRAALRQNPDVLLFGELRDADAAATAVAAAATGHLVLSTLHTADAVGVIPRLRGMGVSDIDLGEALLGVLAQRLLRRVCVGCAQPAEPTAAQLHLFGEALEGRSFVKGAGCPTCGGTGYKGRVGTYELLLVDQGFSERIIEGAPGSALRAYAASQGHLTLVDDALNQAAAGLTTLDELERTIPLRQLTQLRSNQP